MNNEDFAKGQYHGLTVQKALNHINSEFATDLMPEEVVMVFEYLDGSPDQKLESELEEEDQYETTDIFSGLYTVKAGNREYGIFTFRTYHISGSVEAGDFETPGATTSTIRLMDEEINESTQIS